MRAYAAMIARRRSGSERRSSSDSSSAADSASCEREVHGGRGRFPAVAAHAAAPTAARRAATTAISSQRSRAPRACPCGGGAIDCARVRRRLRRPLVQVASGGRRGGRGRGATRGATPRRASGVSSPRATCAAAARASTASTSACATTADDGDRDRHEDDRREDVVEERGRRAAAPRRGERPAVAREPRGRQEDGDREPEREEPPGVHRQSVASAGLRIWPQRHSAPARM